MAAAVFAGRGRLEIRERPLPHVERATDVVLAVEACGICGTDLQILSDPPRHPATPGVVLGHEFVGVVFITHNPHHAYPVGDRFVILNRGRMLGTYAKNDVDQEELVRLMAGGQELAELQHELAGFANVPTEE